MVKVTSGITFRLLHSMAYCETAGRLSGAAPREVPLGTVGVPGLCPPPLPTLALTSPSAGAAPI